VFFGENQSQDRCIRPALVFFGENRSSGCLSFRQVFDQFYLIILLFVLCVPSYSSLRGSIRVCFYVFLVVFRLLVPSKLDSYDVYAQA
jgi:hypothetical protein